MAKACSGLTALDIVTRACSLVLSIELVGPTTEFAVSLLATTLVAGETTVSGLEEEPASSFEICS